MQSTPSAAIFGLISTAGLCLVVGLLGAAPADAGVILYDREDYRGTSERFDEDVSDMRRTRFGDDRARSARVAPGCEATLYADPRFRGRSVVLRGSVASLDHTPLRSDQLTSLRVRCDGGRGDWDDGGRYQERRLRDVWPGDDWDRDDWDRDDWEDGHDLRPGDGVILYADPGYQGRAELLRRDDGKLTDNRIGNDRASSIRVARGCRATLYSDSKYRGRSFSTGRSVGDLRRTPVGDDALSSIQVRCSDGGRDGDWDDDWNGGWGDWGDDGSDGRRGVVLYHEPGFGGRSQGFSRDVDNLTRQPVGNDTVSSIRIAPGCRATLFKDIRFTGRSAVLDGDVADLRQSRVGDDAVSSLTVRCRDRSGDDYGWGDAVVLYQHADFGGDSMGLSRDLADLRGTRIGDDRATSLRIAHGCSATLWSDPGYRGRSIRVRRDVESLAETPLGNDRLSSIEVRCRR